LQLSELDGCDEVTRQSMDVTLFDCTEQAVVDAAVAVARVAKVWRHSTVG
jgi:hypothetical protein